MSGLHSNRYRELVARLTTTRKRAGLTQVEVARALGKLQSFVSKIEQCERRLDPIELLDLVELYAAPLTQLLAGLEGTAERAPHEQAGRPRSPDRPRRPAKG